MKNGQKNISIGGNQNGDFADDTVNYSTSIVSQLHNSMHLKFALNYFDNGWFPIPLCWIENGGCGCHHKHTDPHDIGKAPLFHPDERPTEDKIIEWWTKYPKANIGIQLKPLNLICVDADSGKAVDEVNRMTPLPPSPIVATGRGTHRYFKRPPHAPVTRATKKGKSGAIDVFSAGYVVAPPSLHLSGTRYKWRLPPKAADLAEAPQWALDLLGTSEPRTSTAAHIPQTREVDVNRLQIAKRIKDIIWSGTGTKYNGEPYESRSEAIAAVISSLIAKGYDDDTIVSVFMDSANGISEKPIDKGIRWLLPQIAKQREWLHRRSKEQGTTPPYTHQGGAR